MQEKFEDTKGVIKNHKSQDNCRKRKDINFEQDNDNREQRLMRGINNNLKQ
jgi:hypothetical protein